MANLLLERSCNLIEAAYASRAVSVHSTENPKDWGEYPFTSIWNTQPMQRIREHCAGVGVSFDQCMYGLQYKKPTTVVTNARKRHLLVAKCTHPKGTHANLQGRNAMGKFNSKAQSEYPQELCATLADVLVDQRKVDLRLGRWSSAEAWEDLRRKFGPPLGTLWHPNATAVGTPALPCPALPGRDVQ